MAGNPACPGVFSRPAPVNDAVNAGTGGNQAAFYEDVENLLPALLVHVTDVDQQGMDQLALRICLIFKMGAAETLGVVAGKNEVDDFVGVVQRILPATDRRSTKCLHSLRMFGNFFFAGGKDFAVEIDAIAGRQNVAARDTDLLD